MDELVIDYGLSIPDNCSTLSPLCSAPSYSQSVSSFQHLFNYLAAPASCLFLFHPVLCLLFLSGQLCCTVWPSLWLRAVAFCVPTVLCLLPSHNIPSEAQPKGVWLESSECSISLMTWLNYFKANSYTFNTINYNTSNLCNALQFTEHFHVLSFFKKNSL